MPRVSIITPSLNQGRFIEQTIETVLSQGRPHGDLEYVVVDGGSQDDTLPILRRFGDRLRWVSEPDRGQADAVNKGLRLTSGDVIGWLNSDDIYYPGAVEAACDFLAANPAVDVVYGQAQTIDEQGLVIEPYPTEPFDLQRLADVCFLCQPAVFFRRSVIERFGPLDERLHFVLDYEYWLRLAQGGATFARIPQLLAGWRLYPGIKSVAGRVRMHTEVNEMMLERLGYVPDRWIYNYAHARLEPTSVDSTKHLRFAMALTVLTLWASLRWNRSVPGTVRQTTLIWLKDGVKLLGWSLRAQARARLR
ncbi:MAG TPA: glycosyltransferase family 2 protein [Chloroflexota bacterium]|nr:glycosyltransferase family 2 protein [Chloroflexota bacterium]